MWKEGRDLLLLFFLGLVVGVLSSLSGLGGGFLVVPLLIYLGHKAQLAVGTSFMVVLLVAASSLFAHGRLGNVDYRTGLLLALGGVIGAQAGPILLQAIPEVMFKRLFAGFLVAIGVWLFWTTRTQA